MNQWKSAYAVKTKARSLAEALEGCDAFFGLSAAGVVTKEMVKSMADKPIIFAMANPDPEITPEEVAEVRSDAIVATGRSDYPNQINNVLGFPFIFRGRLGRAGLDHQRGHEDRRRQGAGSSWRAPTCPTRWPPPSSAGR
jgi:malate dehydrogenase (oxaloacetate-decarboxylating)(NADP+)